VVSQTPQFHRLHGPPTISAEVWPSSIMPDDPIVPSSPIKPSVECDPSLTQKTLDLCRTPTIAQDSARAWKSTVRLFRIGCCSSSQSVSRQLTTPNCHIKQEGIEAPPLDLGARKSWCNLATFMPGAIRWVEKACRSRMGAHGKRGLISPSPSPFQA